MNNKYMLWLDDSKKPLTDKINSAVGYYERKYKTTVTVVLLPLGSSANIDGVRVEVAENVIDHHMMVGSD